MTRTGHAPNAILRKMANALMHAGNPAEAAGLYRELLKQTPDDAELLYCAGTAELQCARPAEAERLLNDSLARMPEHVHALVNRGVARLANNRHADALADFTSAVALAPADADAHYNRGSVLLIYGRNEAAIAEFDCVLALQSNHVGAINNRSNALRALKRLDEALAGYDAVVAIDPGHAHGHYNRAVILCELARPDEAMIAVETALTINPDYAEAHCCRGNILREMRRYDEAMAAYECAIALRTDYSDAVWDRSLIELLLGDYENGWRHFEERWRCAVPKSALWFLGKPQWTGGPLTGKTILLHAEQGLGDTLQFCRYAPMVAALGARVLFRAPPSLHALMSTLAGDITVLNDNAPLPFDCHCPLMSLPAAFRTMPETIPADIPYLAADRAKSAAWVERLGPKTRPRIGLVWSGRPGLAPDRTRSARLAQLAPLLGAPYEFHCLQKEIRPIDAAELPRFPQVQTHTDELTDFSDTAALIAQMDVTVSVDTSVAHAAGAIGAPVWLMLPFAPDWRWFLHRDDSPWYPTARLFRQKTRGDWIGVSGDIAEALKKRFS